jgi:hypothetical protein
MQHPWFQLAHLATTCHRSAGSPVVIRDKSFQNERLHGQARGPVWFDSSATLGSSSLSFCPDSDGVEGATVLPGDVDRTAPQPTGKTRVAS